MNRNRILAPSRVAQLVLVGAIIIMSGCTAIPPAPGAPVAPTAQQPAKLNGTVTYLQRIALAPDAVVEVTLQEVSRADAPATIIAAQTIETKGAQVPFAFTLTYDPAQLKPADNLVVRATIKEGGQLTWSSTMVYPVITQGAPADNVEIIVEQVATAQQPATLNGTVTYLARIALAPDAVVEVTLQEVSRADAPATIIAAQTIEPKGAQVPFAFTLTYDPAQLKPADVLVVRATIKEGGKLTWSSTTVYPVITQGAPADNVEIIVEQVATP